MATKTYVTTFTVNGSGQFPFDMLRYDRCHPFSADDAVAIGEPRYGITASERKPITMVRYGHRGYWEPTSARWSSFNWGVDPTSIKTEEFTAP